MKKTNSFTAVLNLVMIVAILSYPESLSESKSLSLENNQKILQICCTWGKSLNDSVLTFYINNTYQQKEKLVTNSFDQWNSKLIFVKFIEVSDPSKADILIIFDHKGEETVGQTTSVLDENGFIKRVRIRISVNFNEELINNDILSLVLKHEIGHALGLGHSNFDDLMNPIVNYQNKIITTCEINAVELANSWKIVQNLQEPKLPELPIEKTVDCDSDET